jgi:hypothetical protein
MTMSTQSRLTVVALFLAAAVTLAQAAGLPLSVRLVTGSKDAGSVDTRLNDVLPLLQQNSGLKSFRLEGEATIDLREGASATLAKGYRLDLSQVQDNKAMVRVSQNQKDLVQTRLSLSEGKPVVVGLDDPAGGKVLVILKLQ